MSWLLDTNTCSYVLKRRFGVAARLRQAHLSQVHICAITIAEATAGAHKSKRREHIIAAWEYFLRPFHHRIIPFDKTAAEQYGELRAYLEKKGTMIGDRDCMIAAIAIVNGLTVVTANTSEFCRVPDLAVENWT